jgi:DNA-binding transcriptional LysR family regulator
MNELDWNLIRTFIAVADSGSLLAAAAKLGVTQPGVGRHINQLEDALGLTLFIRGRSGMKLTDTGLAVLDDARAMRAEFDRFMLKAGGHDERVAGPVRITASRIVSVYILPSMLARLRAAEPELEIELVPDNAVANLLARDADIAIRMVRPTQNDLIATKITDIPLGAFAHVDYLAAHGTPEGIEDLKGHAVIGYDREDRILLAMRQLGLPAERSMFAFRTDDEVAALELVKAGAGIGFAQLHLAAKIPTLRRVLLDLAIPSLPVWLCAHQDLKTSRRIRRTMDFLQEELRKLPVSTASDTPTL